MLSIRQCICRHVARLRSIQRDRWPGRLHLKPLVIQGNHIYTSGATGTNAAVIRGALRAEKPDLLTVVLPQSLSMQPPESQELLAEVLPADSGETSVPAAVGHGSAEGKSCCHTTAGAPLLIELRCCGAQVHESCCVCFVGEERHLEA